MPGPGEVSQEVKEAFYLPPISHRCADFIHLFERVRERLCDTTGARYCAILNGSGTLANEAVASCLEGPGVVLVNGEFGRRLADQARRWEPGTRVIQWPWGVPWDLEQVAEELG